jgi:hypothetical protein
MGLCGSAQPHSPACCARALGESGAGDGHHPAGAARDTFDLMWQDHAEPAGPPASRAPRRQVPALDGDPVMDQAGTGPCRRWVSPVWRRPVPAVRTAMARALRLPAMTTSRFARVTAV